MLPGIVGPDYNYPSFSHLTKYWLDSTSKKKKKIIIIILFAYLICNIIKP